MSCAGTRARKMIKMGLRSEGEQDVTVAALDLSVHFGDEEELLTEVSAKFTPSGITEELSASGFATIGQWQDPAGDYAVTLARRVSSQGEPKSHFGAAYRPGGDGAGRSTVEAYRDVRAVTEALASTLSGEDQTVQSMPDVSPTKWHRAHVTWFFEQFVLAPHRLPVPADGRPLRLFVQLLLRGRRATARPSPSADCYPVPV